MTNYLLLAASLGMNLLSCAVIRNDFCKKRVKTDADLYFFNALSALASVVCFVIAGKAMGSLRAPSAYTLWMGAAFGVVTGLCAVFAMLALRTGPLSYTNVIVFCSMVIPSLSGLALYGEPVSALQFAGIGLMAVSFVFAVEKKDTGSGTSLRWFLLCMGAFFANGAVGVMQKVHQNSPYAAEIPAFLITAFTVYLLLSLSLCAYFAGAKKQPLPVFRKGERGRTAVYALLTGVGVAACNQLNLYLAGAMPAAVFYPVFNGAAMLLTGVIGLVFFKEKLSKKQWLGLLAGAAAIMMLCLQL